MTNISKENIKGKILNILENMNLSGQLNTPSKNMDIDTNNLISLVKNKL